MRDNAEQLIDRGWTTKTTPLSEPFELAEPDGAGRDTDIAENGHRFGVSASAEGWRTTHGFMQKHQFGRTQYHPSPQIETKFCSIFFIPSLPNNPIEKNVSI